MVCATSRFEDCFLDEEMRGALKPSGQGSWAEEGLERRSWQVCRSSEGLALSLGCSAWKSILGFFSVGFKDKRIGWAPVNSILSPNWASL